jgi:putative sigma-54 modulation protein
MDSEEAILQMNMLKYTFSLFVNSERNQTNVVYPRNDGRYGLIETK